MEKEFFYVFCSGILGVRTNIEGFSWIYGSAAPCSSLAAYETCAIKFDIRLVPEKELEQSTGENIQHFQAYVWNDRSHTLSCRRTLFGKIKLGYDLTIKENTVSAQIGKNYYRFVKHRVMNLHGVYYLLSDLANILLLKNGYLSLYASAVYNRVTERCLVSFAPPNTGKTYTAV